MGKEKLVKTPLLIAYRKGNKLTLMEGLDPDIKDAVWGVQLSDGIIISTNFFVDLRYYQTCSVVKKLRLNGKKGSMPTIQQMKQCVPDKNEAFSETVKILKKYGVDAKYFNGCVWCSDVHSFYTELQGVVDFTYNTVFYIHRTAFDNDFRIALVF